MIANELECLAKTVHDLEVKLSEFHLKLSEIQFCANRCQSEIDVHDIKIPNPKYEFIEGYDLLAQLFEAINK